MKRMWWWRNITLGLLFALVTNGIAAEPRKDLEKVRVGLPAKAIDFSHTIWEPVWASIKRKVSSQSSYSSRALFISRLC